LDEKLMNVMKRATLRAFLVLIPTAFGASALSCSSTDQPSNGGSAGSAASGAAGTNGGAGTNGSAGTNAGSAGNSSVGGGAGANTAGSSSTGGAAAGTTGQGGTGDAGGSAGDGGSGGGGASECPAECVSNPASRETCSPCFSFFVTSVEAMQRLSSNPNGFGGDLRFGKADGLSGADEICRQVAEDSMPGAGSKTWRAFLSVVNGPGGGPVHAKDRIGTGPWYDRVGRLVAASLTNLIQERPQGADPAIRDDLPNEHGIPNHLACEGCANPQQCCDNHDILTGTGPNGMLYTGSSGSGGGPGAGGGFFNCSGLQCTCNDWTSAVGSAGTPWVGHSWPRQGSGVNWMSALAEAGCAPGVFLNEMGGPQGDTVGGGGGYGGIYCFAVAP
jgi:hypothetical protein